MSAYVPVNERCVIGTQACDQPSTATDLNGLEGSDDDRQRQSNANEGKEERISSQRSLELIESSKSMVEVTKASQR